MPAPTRWPSRRWAPRRQACLSIVVWFSSILIRLGPIFTLNNGRQQCRKHYVCMRRVLFKAPQPSLYIGRSCTRAQRARCRLPQACSLPDCSTG